MRRQLPLFGPAGAVVQAQLDVLELLDAGAQLVVSVSGGKDSQAMVDFLVEMLHAHGLQPRERMVLVNADLGRVEWDVREHLEAVAAHYGGLELHVVHPNRDLLDSIVARGRWPSKPQRYCTSDHKRAPIQKWMRRTARERGWSLIVHCLGERAQESPGRRKLLERALERDERLCLKDGSREVWTWHPVLDLTLDGVWRRIAASGLPAHPVYAEGMSRLSCCFCVFARPSDLRIARRLRPELYQLYLDAERRMGHRFTDRFALAQLAEVEDAGETGPP